MAKEDKPGPPPVKCPECTPGLPGWMATFSDLVTLLLTFFVLLLSFAKTESAKYEAALGSIRNAFGGNVFRQGEVIQKGKSPDDHPTMLESQEPIRPFPIETLSSAGILDKYEINRESDEDLNQMRKELSDYGLSEDALLYETSSGIRVHLKDKIYFDRGQTTPRSLLKRELLDLLSKTKWKIYVMGYASLKEQGPQGENALALSAKRSLTVATLLAQKGTLPEHIITSFYGDSRHSTFKGTQEEERRVELMIRKVDITEGGHRVDSR